jgi:hypothetical protein
VLLICYNDVMNLTQTPENLIVIRDGQLDQEYYDQVWEEKRRAALDQAKRELIRNLCGVPAKLGRGILTVMSHIAEQAN